MKLKNCPECGKLYIESTAGMCPDCARLEQINEKKIADYAREHPDSSIADIHEATGVKESTILRMIREGRFLSLASISYPCESCGAPIAKGRVCEKCRKNFLLQLKKINEQDKQAKKTKGIGLCTEYYKNKSHHP